MARKKSSRAAQGSGTIRKKTVRRKFPRQYKALFESDFRTFTEDN